MNKLANLQKRAAVVSRALFASLPFHRRLAIVLAALVDTDLQALGRALGTVFIHKKVQGLPDINGKPALETPANRVPPNYLHDFAANIRQILRSKSHSEDVADLTIANWLYRFVAEGGWQKMEEGRSLSEVRSYILNSLINQEKDELRRQKKNQMRNPSLDVTNEEGHATFEPSDPEATKKFYEHIQPHSLPRVRRVLEQKVHPDAPLFLDLLLEGHRATDIVGDPTTGRPTMLPHLKDKPLSYRNWKKTYEPKIYHVLREFAEQEAV